MKSAILLAISCLLIACTAEEVVESIQPRPDAINLKDPQIGQKNHYIRYHSENSSDQSTIDYTGDTLTIEIIRITGNNISLFEKLTPSSPNISEFPTRISSITIFEDSIEHNTCGEPNKSMLLNYTKSISFESRDSLFTNIGKWKADNTKGDHTANAEINSQNFEYLLMKFSRYSICDILITHGPLITTLYSKEHFIVRAIFEDFYGGYISGWDLVAD